MNIYDSLAYSLRRWRYKERPMPRIETNAGFMLPGALVRLVGVAAVGACVGLGASATHMAVVAIALLVVLVSAWGLLRPGFEVGIATIGAAGFFLAISPSAPFNPVTPWVILAGYLGLRLMMASQLVTWKAKVAPVVLLNWRDALITGATAAIGLAIRLPGVGVWAVVVGLVTIAILAAAIARHLRRPA